MKHTRTIIERLTTIHNQRPDANTRFAHWLADVHFGRFAPASCQMPMVSVSIKLLNNLSGSIFCVILKMYQFNLRNVVLILY